MMVKRFANILTIFVFLATANSASGQTVAIRSVSGEPNKYFTVASGDCGSEVTLWPRAGANENQVSTRQIFEVIDLNGGSLKYDDEIRIKKCGNYLRVNSEAGLDSVPPQNRGGTPDSATVFIIRAPANSSNTGEVELFVLEAEISNTRGFYITTGTTPLKASSDFLGNPRNVLKLVRNPQASTASGPSAPANQSTSLANNTRVVCMGTVPSGWIRTATSFHATDCPSPGASVAHNRMTIHRYDNKPVGAVMSVCVGSIPNGWVKDSSSRDGSTCQQPNPNIDNVMLIRRVK